MSNLPKLQLTVFILLKSTPKSDDPYNQLKLHFKGKLGSSKGIQHAK